MIYVECIYMAYSYYSKYKLFYGRSISICERERETPIMEIQNRKKKMAKNGYNFVFGKEKKGGRGVMNWHVNELQTLYFILSTNIYECNINKLGNNIFSLWWINKF